MLRYEDLKCDKFMFSTECIFYTFNLQGNILMCTTQNNKIFYNIIKYISDTNTPNNIKELLLSRIPEDNRLNINDKEEFTGIYIDKNDFFNTVSLISAGQYNFFKTLIFYTDLFFSLEKIKKSSRQLTNINEKISIEINNE